MVPGEIEMSDFLLAIKALGYSVGKSTKYPKKALKYVTWIASKIPRRETHICICINCNKLVEIEGLEGLEQWFDYENGA